MNASACAALDRLDRLALRSPALRRFVVDRHVRATQAVLPCLGGLGGKAAFRIGVVGGGNFPRTVLVLRHVLPAGELVVVEARRDHIERALAWLVRAGLSERGVAFREGTFDARQAPEFDLLVVPLGYRGDRDALYRMRPAPAMLIHDWLWRPRGDRSVVVSPWLLKRLNVVLPARDRR